MASITSLSTTKIPPALPSDPTPPPAYLDPPPYQAPQNLPIPLNSRDFAVLELPPIIESSSQLPLDSVVSYVPPADLVAPAPLSIAQPQSQPRPQSAREDTPADCCEVAFACCQLLNCCYQAEITAEAFQDLQGNPNLSNTYIDVAAINGNPTAQTAVALRGDHPVLLNPNRCECCAGCVRDTASGIFGCLRAIICCIPQSIHFCCNQIPPGCCDNVGEIACQCIGCVGGCLNCIRS